MPPKLVPTDVDDLPKGISRIRSLPDATLGSLWQSIIIPDAMRGKLLSQAALNFTVRGKVGREDLPLHGIILLTGLPGTGKTSLAKGLAHRVAETFPNQRFRLLEVEPHSLTSSAMGKTQRAVSDLFAQTIAEAAAQGPTIVLLDEVETLAVDRTRLSMDANPIDIHRATDAVLVQLDSVRRAVPQPSVRCDKQFSGRDRRRIHVSLRSHNRSAAARPRGSGGDPSPVPEGRGRHLSRHCKSRPDRCRRRLRRGMRWLGWPRHPQNGRKRDGERSDHGSQSEQPDRRTAHQRRQRGQDAQSEKGPSGMTTVAARAFRALLPAQRTKPGQLLSRCSLAAPAARSEMNCCLLPARPPRSSPTARLRMPRSWSRATGRERGSGASMTRTRSTRLGCNEDTLGFDPLQGDWRVSLPCPAEELAWVQASLARASSRITARDLAETTKPAEQASAASTDGFDIDVKGFLS